MDRESLLIESYRLFEMTLSGRGNLEINGKIKKKVDYLKKRYNLGAGDLLHTLFMTFIEHRHYEKYDPAKTRLATFVAHYIRYALLDLIKKYDAAFDGFIEVPLSQGEDEKMPRSGASLSLSYLERRGLDTVIDYSSPEGHYAAKQLAQLISDHFDENEILVLVGFKTRESEAERLSVSYECYCKRLARKTAAFFAKLKAAGYR